MGMSVKFAGDNKSYALINAEALSIEKGRSGVKLIIDGGNFEDIKERFMSPEEYDLLDPDGPEPQISLTEFCVLYEIMYSNGRFYVTMAQKTADERIEELTQQVSELNAEVMSLQSGAEVV
jgi:hypothetical protein